MVVKGRGHDAGCCLHKCGGRKLRGDRMSVRLCGYLTLRGGTTSDLRLAESAVNPGSVPCVVAPKIDAPPKGVR